MRGKLNYEGHTVTCVLMDACFIWYVANCSDGIWGRQLWPTSRSYVL